MDNLSLDGQLADCKRYAERRGLKIIIVYEDVGSGLSLKARPKFVDMCKDILEGNKRGIKKVVFWDLDRFTRSNRHFYNFADDLVAAGATLHLKSEEEEYNHSTAISWQQRIQSAEIESRKISKRTKAGQRRATALGLHIGPPPWGYLLNREPGEADSCGRLIPDPELWR